MDFPLRCYVVEGLRETGINNLCGEDNVLTLFLRLSPIQEAQRD